MKDLIPVYPEDFKTMDTGTTIAEFSGETEGNPHDNYITSGDITVYFRNGLLELGTDVTVCITKNAKQ